MVEYNKEYGRKPAYSDLSYPLFIREVTSRAVWNTVIADNPDLSEFNSRLKRLTSFERSILEYLRQSEFKKPYITGNFENMEYVGENPPGITPRTPDWPNIDRPPEFPPPYPPPPTGPGEGLSIFSFSVLGCYCPDGALYECEASGSHIITGITVEDGSAENIVVLDPYSWKFDLVTSKTTGTVLVKGYMVSGAGVRGSGEDTLISCGLWQCCNDLAWSESSAKTIVRSTSESIFVDGGTGPYSWSVTGTDYSLGSAETIPGANTLIAGASSCGMAYIEVVDANECTTSGYVRNTTGSWSQLEVGESVASCNAPGEGYLAGDNTRWRKTNDQYLNESKLVFTLSGGGGCFWAGTNTCESLFDDAFDPPCEDRCGYAQCLQNCEPCVTPVFTVGNFPNCTTYISWPTCWKCTYVGGGNCYNIENYCYCGGYNRLWEWIC